MKAKFLFLGSGASMGTPVIGCSCPVCTKADPKQIRLRPSGLVTIGDTQILIDAGPDFRQQALRENITRIDAVCLTHEHYDHTAGIEDLRIYYYKSKRPIPCFLSEYTNKIWETKSHVRGFFSPCVLSSFIGHASISSCTFSYFHYLQKETPVTGFRFGSFAYVTDISHYKPAVFSALQGVKTLVISACNVEQSVVHLGLKQAIAFAKKVGAITTFFTHISHRIDVCSFESFLPSSMQFAYDGLEIGIEY